MAIQMLSRRFKTLNVAVPNIEPLPDPGPLEEESEGVRDCGPRGEVVWQGNVETCSCDPGFWVTPGLEQYGCVVKPDFGELDFPLGEIPDDDSVGGSRNYGQTDD